MNMECHRRNIGDALHLIVTNERKEWVIVRTELYPAWIGHHGRTVECHQQRKTARI